MENTKTKGKKLLMIGLALLAAFIVWTILIQTVDVQPVGQNGTDIGFATLNCWFHALTGVHMTIYTITDWLGLVPLLICVIFGGIGFIQLVNRKSLIKVDSDIIILGVYYIVVIFGYVIFEMIPINYRPIRIDGFLEASYPSSTTLLVLSVMLSLMEQVYRRVKHTAIRNGICVAAVIFSAYMVIGRTISGVHWFTDIVGSVILSAGLFFIYQSVVWLCNREV